MRVGVGVGPFYASSRVNSGCTPGCLLSLLGTAVVLGVLGTISAGVQDHNQGTVVAGIVVGVVALAVVGGITALVYHYQRDGERTDIAIHAGQDCRSGGPHAWQPLGMDAQRRIGLVCTYCRITSYTPPR